MGGGYWRSMLVTALLLLAPTSARAEWLQAESPNFIVLSDGSESRLRERVQLLEDFDALLRTLTSANREPAPVKLRIYLLDGGRDLRALRDLPPGVGGFYTATDDGIGAFIDTSSPRDTNEILFHEYAHHFMWQNAANAYPAWYVEGFADYFANTRITGRRIDVGDVSQGRAGQLLQGRWLPMDRVLFGTTRGLDRDDLGMFYAQSWLLTHWFYSTPERAAALNRYLNAARRGDPAAALQAATGFTPEALGQELRRYMHGNSIRYRQMMRPDSWRDANITVARLGPASDVMVLFDAHLRIGVRDDLQQDFLTRLRTAAARHPQDPFARRVLAFGEAAYGDPAVADRLLEPLIAEAPADAELLYFKGLRFLNAAEKGEDWGANTRHARTWFGRAHQVDGNHWQTLYRYAQSLRRDPASASENTSNILMLAHQLAPQVAGIRMNAASLLIERGDHRAAEALLRPLADDPHNRSLAEAAARLIERARQRGATPAASGAPAQQD